MRGRESDRVSPRVAIIKLPSALGLMMWRAGRLSLFGFIRRLEVMLVSSDTESLLQSEE
jgi:hypothetical protein